MKEEYFKPREVAAKLRISTRSVQLMLNDGKLRAIRIGKQWRIPESAVDELIRGIEEASAPVIAIRGVR
jgi:excisionase family DNA binding protein